MSILNYKKDKSFPAVDHKSFNAAQSKIDKLRPVKDRIIFKVKHVNGFAGCFISDKIRVLCTTAEARKEIRRILNRYTNVEIVNVNDIKESDVITKPKATFKSFKSARNVMTRSKSHHTMTELRRHKSP